MQFMWIVIIVSLEAVPTVIVWKYSIIKVCPAANLQCYGIRSNGYKEKGKKAERDEILNELRKVVDIRCESLHIHKEQMS